MLMIILIAFVAVFGIVFLLMQAGTRPEVAAKTRATLARVLSATHLTGKNEVVDIRKEHRLSSIPWLHEMLSRMRLALNLRLLLGQADLKWTPGKLLLISTALWAVFTCVVNLRLHSNLLAALIGLFAGVLPFVHVWRKREKRLLEFQQRLPEALDLIVGALRSGHSMISALGAVAKDSPEPIGREFRLCFEEQNYGIDLRTAMQNLMERVPVQDLRMTATAMLIHKDTGGNLADVLEKTAAVVRERFQLQQGIRVHTAQGRISGWVLLFLPVVLGVVLQIVNPGYLQALFDHPLGHKLIAGALCMDAIGLLVIRKIVRIRV